MHCPNGFKDILQDKYLIATCIGGKYFQIGTEKHHKLKKVRCVKNPWITLQPQPAFEKRNYCTKNSVADIGFRISENNFVKTMTICHDAEKLKTYFVTYKLSAFNAAYQRGVSRLSFIQTRNLNHSTSYSKLYSKDNQVERISAVLGSEEDIDQYFDADKWFFSRGHLGAKADFFTANQQRSTFFYLNTAPQFQSINGGNWQRVEDQIRRFVAKRIINATIISGTHGVLRFPSLEDNEIFLGDHGQLPVPQYFYKIVYDEFGQRGVVFVSINNPHLEREDVQDYIFCTNVMEQINWITLKDSISAGVIFACEVEEFLQEMPDGLLPNIYAPYLLL